MDEPYVFISVLHNKEAALYNVVKPLLTPFEKNVFERVYENLRDVLALKDIELGGDKNTILT